MIYLQDLYNEYALGSWKYVEHYRRQHARKNHKQYISIFPTYTQNVIIRLYS